MAKMKLRSTKKSRAVNVKVKERKSWNALIRRRFEEVPRWWEKKWSDMKHLVIEACNLQRKPTHTELAYKVAHDLLYNEKRRQKNKAERARAENVA